MKCFSRFLCIVGLLGTAPFLRAVEASGAPNLLSNASFEDGVWSGHKNMRIDDSGHHSATGRSSLHLIDAEGDKGSDALRVTVPDIVPSAPYRLALKAKGAAGLPLKVKIHWQVPGQSDAVEKLERRLEGDRFEDFVLETTSPAGATQARLYIENWTKGSEVWVDDVFFGTTAPAVKKAPSKVSLPVWTPQEGMRISEWLFQPGTKVTAAPDPQLWEPVKIPFTWTNGAGGIIKTPERKFAAWVTDGKEALKTYDNGWFERTVTIPADWSGQRIWLKFDQVDCDAMLWVNDAEPIYIEGPEARVDLTSLVKPGQEAKLRVWVTRWWEGIPKTMKADPLREQALLDSVREDVNKLDEIRTEIPAGLTGYVHFEVRPMRAEVESIFARPSWREKSLFAEIDLRNTNLKGAQLKVEVLDPSGKGGDLPSAIQVPLEVTGSGTQTVRIPWTSPRLWELGDGYLYALRASVLDSKGGVIHTSDSVPFGFREIWVEGRNIMMNGHPIHLFIAPAISVHWPSLLFWKGLGFNVMQWHPHPGSWFDRRGRRSLIIDQADDPGMRSIRPDVLEQADAEGFGLLMPAPNATKIRGSLDDPRALQAYQRETDLWFKRLRNHPSILMWMPSMNAGSASRDNPMRVGMNPDAGTIPKWYNAVDSTIKKLDPTRLVSHHCGLVGEVDYPNQYLNFMPLQERIEFPSHWAAEGDRPWGAIEHGAPVYEGDYFKPFGIPLYPQWHAVYFGDRAYDQETDAYVNLLAESAARKDEHHGNLTGLEQARMGEMTAQDDFERLFTRETHRYWRAFGVAGGWKPWNFGSGYGINPGYKKGSFNYEDLSEEEARATLKAAPEWANATYHVYRETLQPLLVFLGGPTSRITAKDHIFYSGEKFEKSLIAIWDGNKEQTINATWKLESEGKVVKQGEVSLTLKPGEIIKKPIELQAPDVQKRTDGQLTVVVRDESGKETMDTIALSFWPQDTSPIVTKSRWAIYDPAGRSAAWLKSLGVEPVEVKDKEALMASGAEVLVLGRESLADGAPFTLDDIKDGLRVLILEQKPTSLESLGLRIQDIVSRLAFPRDKASSLLSGLQESDLANWRGEPDLLPLTSEGMKKWALARPPHWGNQGAVSSVVLETPHAGAFTPIVEAEFGLNYSPLLEWREGRGGIVFSQFDLTDRVGTDPAATQLARNLIRTLDQPFVQPQDRTVRYFGSDTGWDYLQRLGFSTSRIDGKDFGALDPKQDILVVGPAGWPQLATGFAAVQKFVTAGGQVLVLAQSPADLASFQAPFALPTEPVKRARVKMQEAPILRGIGTPLLHWNTFLTQDRFIESSNGAGSTILLEGLVLDRPEGKGQWVFSQLDWSPLEDSNRLFELPRRNVMKFYRQLLTNLGARNEQRLAARVTSPKGTAPMITISPWRNWNDVALVDKKSGEGNIFPGLATPLPVEKNALPDTNGDTNQLLATIGEGEVKEPALEKAQGGWRTYGPKGSSGFLHLDWISPPGSGKVGYSRTYIYSSQEREATFAVGADWWIVFRVNGKAYIDHSKQPRPSNAPYAGEFRFTAPLKKGWNLLEAKVASGGTSFGFWAQVSDPGDLVVSAAPPTAKDVPSQVPQHLLQEPDLKPHTVLYSRPFEPRDDPYRFNPW